jgi:general secretion pathway protein N
MEALLPMNLSKPLLRTKWSQRGRRPAAMKAPWTWGGLGALLGTVLSVLLFAPAHWLEAAVSQASDGKVQLHDASGTVWSGSAQIVLTGGAGSVATASLPSRMSWELRPAWSGLSVQLQAACCLKQPWDVKLAPLWGGWRVSLSDSPSVWPAQLLTGLGTPFNTMEPQGHLALHTQGLNLTWAQGRLQMEGSALLDVQDLSSRLSTLSPMGSYRFDLMGGATPQLQLSTLSGALKLSGQGQWVGGRLRFAGEASSAPEHLAVLSNLLNIIGRRDGARSVIQLG